jgi:2-methylcitrate dehydratase PrpD
MTDILPVTAALSAYIASAQTVDHPEEHLDLAKCHILDTLASIVACRDLAPAVLARDYALTLSGDARRSSATILGTRTTASIVDAVFASAMTGHAAEINDFIPSAFVQPGPAIVSATVALAENRGLTGDQILRAVIVGYELAGRIPKSLGIDNLRRAHIANHGIGPTFGTAAAAASLIGLPEDRISDVLTYCAQQASGSWQWLLDVEHIEKAFVFAGMGARAGLHAALMSEAGFRGVRDALDNPAGWMMSDIFSSGDSDRAYLIDGLGIRSELNHTAYKRYPVGGPTQPAVQGLLDLLPDIDRANVETVRIEIPGRWQAFRDAAMPALNLRYLTAIILIDGRLDFVAAQSRERMLGDLAVRSLMDRIEIVHDASQEAKLGEPRTESARIIVTGSGDRREIYVPYVVGFPSHPMSRADVEAKAAELMSPSLGSDRAQAIIETVGRLEVLKNGGALAALIAG